MAYIIYRIANTISSSPAVGSEVIRYRDDVKTEAFCDRSRIKMGAGFLVLRCTLTKIELLIYLWVQCGGCAIRTTVTVLLF